MDLSPDLLASYRGTVYWVETPQRCFPLRIGRRHPEFDAFLTEQGVGEWAFLTACNPRSELLAPAENRRRNSELGLALSVRLHWPGLGVGFRGDWFPEASFCAAISESEGLALARQFGQHAIVVGRRGEPAVLRIV